MATPRPEIAMPFEGYNDVQPVEPSMWSQVGNAFANNADLITALAGQWGKYETQKAKDKAQSYINQAASKWSGFNPSLMNLVKPAEVQNPVAMGMEAIGGGPMYWHDLQKLYDARSKAQKGDEAAMEAIKKEKRDASLNQALAAAAASYGR